MRTGSHKKQDNHSEPASTHAIHSTDDRSPMQFVDNRPETTVNSELQNLANNSEQVKQSMQWQAMANKSAQSSNPIQKKNNTGLPDTLKTGIENLSGYAMDDVKVHRNSNEPAQLNAHAYAQGTDIHLGPGQEKHLPHEAWHVVQQKQGRVKPTLQRKGKVNINDDAGLENEADVMGAKALASGAVQRKIDNLSTVNGEQHEAVFKKESAQSNNRAANVVQRFFTGELEEMEISKIVGKIDKENQGLLAHFDEVSALKADLDNEYKTIDELIDAIKEMRAKREDKEKEEASSEDVEVDHEKERSEHEMEKVTKEPSHNNIDLIHLEDSESGEGGSPMSAIHRVRRTLLKTEEAGNLSVSSRDAKLRAKQADFSGQLAFRTYSKSLDEQVDTLQALAEKIKKQADLKGDKNYENLAELVIRAVVLEHSGGGYCDHLSAATFLELVAQGKKPVWIRYVPKSDSEYSIEGPHEEKNENYHRSVGIVDQETSEFTEVDAWVPEGGRIRVFDSFGEFKHEYHDTMEVLWEWDSSDSSFLEAAKEEIASRVGSEYGQTMWTWKDDGRPIDMPIWKVEKTK